MNDNICLLTDSYKVTHWKQYPPGTETIYSYFESRIGAKYPKTLFFGLQYFLKEYLAGRVVTKTDVLDAQRLYVKHFGADWFNFKGWMHIIEKHGGRLPVRIKAVPEGTLVPASNVLMTIENTDPACYWLTNWLETLLVQVWYPCTIATRSWTMKQTLLKYLEETGDPKLVDFKLHDFGFRGVTCPEQAAIGGCAHLVNFRGTDTVAALDLAATHYNCDMAGFSVPASEHSTIITWEHELDAFRNMLKQFPSGLVACVSDSYDIFHACEHYWGEALHDDILNRNGVLIIRPDSGDPAAMVYNVLIVLGDIFGTTKNDKGYKLLNPHIRIIQGDGIDEDSMEEVLKTMWKGGWSADNIAFGSGGGLLQKMNRDTQRFAFKCSSITANGVSRDVCKTTLNDTTKASKPGRLKLIKDLGEFKTVNASDPKYADATDHLVTVFENGIMMVNNNLDAIRKRVLA